MKYLTKIKNFYSKISNFFLDQSCGCGTKKINKKGLILIALIIVVLILT